MGILTLVFAAALAQQGSCEALKSLTIPNATITAAEAVAAGTQQPARGGRGQALSLPAHCRVALTLTPSRDSQIDMELLMPADNWNGNFLAVGNGGWAGNIETGRHGGRSRAGLRGRLERHRAQRWERVVRRRASREARRLRLPRHARDGGRVEDDDPELLQTGASALLLPGLFDGRPAGADGGPALPCRFRRDCRRRSRLQPDSSQRVAGVASGRHAQGSVAHRSGEQGHAAGERCDRGMR